MPKLALGGSRLEELASKALEHDPLGSFNLRASRKTLSDMLAAIGTTSEFATYTRHDITHIDALLQAADWVIPQSTFQELTVADALVLTLAIYVHDLGMLVTKTEFAAREATGFPGFKDEILNDVSDRGVDFRDRLDALGVEDREHFLYEEFVRVHHAERIEAWILGSPDTSLGVASEAMALVTSVFSSLDPVVRRDIALVARSHHADDLDDLGKYKLNRAYGGHPQETANLQYAALVLRTVDLLHMTRDRTPIVQFRLASPADPLGQREWQKQQSVRAVKPRPSGQNASNTIEVHAAFEKAEGFFALMEYLDYCESQLALSAKWASIAAASSELAARYSFPWAHIDREQIEAEGFDRHQFTFSFDQQKVLELLTGHTTMPASQSENSFRTQSTRSGSRRLLGDPILVKPTLSSPTSLRHGRCAYSTTEPACLNQP
jgi:molecular chaperone HtpG